MRNVKSLAAAILAIGLVSAPAIAAKSPAKKPAAKTNVAKPAVKPAAMAPKTAVAAPAASAPTPAAPTPAVAAATAGKAAFSTADSTLGDLIDNPATKAVLDKFMPGLSTNDQIAMARPMTLRAIQPMAGDRIKVEVLDLIDAELAKIPGK